MTTTATDFDIDHDGRRLHGRRWGAPEHHPLLLVHGYPGHTGVWDRFAAAMADRHHVVAVDLAGHGGSDWADSYSFDGWVADLHAVVSALDLAPFTLVGHSLGATLGFCYAAAHPAAPDRLIAVDGLPAGAWEPTTPNAGALPAGFATLGEFARFVGLDPAAAEVGRITDPRLQLVEPGADGGYVWRHDPAVREAVLRELRFDPARRRAAAARIRVPVDYLRCGRTHVGPYEETAAILRDFPTCRLTNLPDADHALPTRAPATLITTTRRLGL